MPRPQPEKSARDSQERYRQPCGICVGVGIGAILIIVVAVSFTIWHSWVGENWTARRTIRQARGQGSRYPPLDELELEPLPPSRYPLLPLDEEDDEPPSR